MEYRHTQVGRLINLGVVPAIVTAAFLLHVGLRGAAGLVLGLGLLIFFLMGWLSVTVTATHVFARFGIGLVRKRVALAEIEATAIVRNPWYYGLGIHYIPGGVIWNIAGSSAVELTLAGGWKLRIGTNEPDELLEAIVARRPAVRRRP